MAKSASCQPPHSNTPDRRSQLSGPEATASGRLESPPHGLKDLEICEIDGGDNVFETGDVAQRVLDVFLELNLPVFG